MNKFIKINNIVFAITFGLLGIFELIGFLTGHTWCAAATLLLFFLSWLFWDEYKKCKTQS